MSPDREDFLETRASPDYDLGQERSLSRRIFALLLVASSAITRDVYQQTWHPELTADQLTGMSRRVTFGLAVIALAMALGVAIAAPGRTVFWKMPR